MKRTNITVLVTMILDYIHAMASGLRYPNIAD